MIPLSRGSYIFHMKRNCAIQRSNNLVPIQKRCFVAQVRQITAKKYIYRFSTKWFYDKLPELCDGQWGSSHPPVLHFLLIQIKALRSRCPKQVMGHGLIFGIFQNALAVQM